MPVCGWMDILKNRVFDADMDVFWTRLNHNIGLNSNDAVFGLRFY